MTGDFWSGRRVLLTGHTGFKGAWAALWLERLGATVTGLALPPATEPSLFEILSPWPRLASRFADLRDPEQVEAAVVAAEPQVVIHMAAQALVLRSYAEPLETIATNVMGSAHLMESLRRCEALETLLVVTSDKVYLNREDGRAHAEDDPLGGDDPYSASKAATEILVRAWAGSFFQSRQVAVATARAGNVIGGGDWSENRIVPDLWRAARAGQPVVLRNPEATRPWQHVLEPLGGYLHYVEALAGPDTETLPRALNFGPAPGPELTVAEVADAVSAAFGQGEGWRPDEGERPKEKQSLRIDSAAATRALGWRPRLSMQETLDWTVAWYRAEQTGEDMRDKTLEQIEAYQALA